MVVAKIWFDFVLGREWLVRSDSGDATAMGWLSFSPLFSLSKLNSSLNDLIIFGFV